MKTYLQHLIHLISIVCLTVSIVARADSSGVESNTTYVPPMEAPSSSSSNGSSGQSGMAKAQQLLGAGMNAATGAMMQNQCKACKGECNWACAMAAMSYAQAALMAMSALGSDKTKKSSTGSYSGADGLNKGLTGTTDGTAEEANNFDPSIAGFSQSDIPADVWPYDPETGVLTTPDGEVSINPDATPSQIAGALGGSPSDMSLAESTAIRLGEAAMEKLNEDGLVKPSVSGMGVESYGGGSSYGSGRKAGKGINFADFMGGGYNRGPAAVNKEKFKNGKSRMLNGEHIGIKMDDIFAMVHRRYQEKRKANVFLETIITDEKKQ